MQGWTGGGDGGSPPPPTPQPHLTPSPSQGAHRGCGGRQVASLGMGRGLLGLVGGHWAVPYSPQPLPEAGVHGVRGETPPPPPHPRVHPPPNPLLPHSHPHPSPPHIPTLPRLIPIPRGWGVHEVGVHRGLAGAPKVGEGSGAEGRPPTPWGSFPKAGVKPHLH